MSFRFFEYTNQVQHCFVFSSPRSRTGQVCELLHEPHAGQVCELVPDPTLIREGTARNRESLLGLLSGPCKPLALHKARLRHHGRPQKQKYQGLLTAKSAPAPGTPLVLLFGLQTCTVDIKYVFANCSRWLQSQTMHQLAPGLALQTPCSPPELHCLHLCISYANVIVIASTEFG